MVLTTSTETTMPIRDEEKGVWRWGKSFKHVQTVYIYTPTPSNTNPTRRQPRISVAATERCNSHSDHL